MARAATPHGRIDPHSVMNPFSLRNFSILTALVVLVGYTMVFFYAPQDVEGFIQKIFYLHVPLAIVALVGFIVAAIHAIRHLRTGDPKHDARAYVSIHLSIILGVAVLITGGIWAKAQWGAWWVWDEPTLVSFLIVFLLYCTYYPLRYAIEDRERQARYASVFAITAGAFVPLNFMAVRLADPFIHPRTFSSTGGLPGEMAITFLVCLIGIAMLWTLLVRYELASKMTQGRISRLRRAIDAEAPAAPSSRIAPAPEPSSGS